MLILTLVVAKEHIGGAERRFLNAAERLARHAAQHPDAHGRPRLRVDLIAGAPLRPYLPDPAGTDLRTSWAPYPQWLPAAMARIVMGVSIQIMLLLRLLGRRNRVVQVPYWTTSSFLPGMLLAARRTTVDVVGPTFVDSHAASVLRRLPFQRAGAVRFVSRNVHRIWQQRCSWSFDPAVHCQVMSTPAPPMASSTGADKERLVCYACRFIERKNPLVMARAACRFVQAYPDWKVVILGRGELESAVRSETAEEARVEVAFVPDPGSYFARAQVMVSIIETGDYPSQSVLEAMAHGCYLILADRGQSARFLTPDGISNGQLIEPREEQLVEALTWVAKNEEEVRAGGRRSIQHLPHIGSPAAYDGEWLRHLHNSLAARSKR